VVAEGMPILTRHWLVEHTITATTTTKKRHNLFQTKLAVATKIDAVTALKIDSSNMSIKNSAIFDGKVDGITYI